MTRDLLALAFANGCLVVAGHGVLRAIGFGPAPRDLPWSLGVAYLAGAAAVGVLGSILLVAGLSLTAWQLVALCAALLAIGLARRRELRRPERVPTLGLLRVFPWATALALAILAVDLAVQPIWTDDAWSIWTIKAASIVELDGLDPEFLSSAAVFNADYPLVVPVLELVALRFTGWPTELVPLQLGLVFIAFPAALVALLREWVRPLVLWTVVLGVAVAPSLQVQTASAVADITLAVFFALAGLAGWRWVETGERGLLWLAGLFGAAAIGTKAEGIVFVVLLFTALAVASRRRAAVARRRRRRPDPRALGALDPPPRRRQRDRRRRRRDASGRSHGCRRPGSTSRRSSPIRPPGSRSSPSAAPRSSSASSGTSGARRPSRPRSRLPASPPSSSPTGRRRSTSSTTSRRRCGAS